MDLTQTRLKFLRLARERGQLERELLKKRPMLGGPLVLAFLTCGKAGCACHTSRKKRHGPYAYVQVKRAKRYTHRYIHNQPKLIELARNYSKFISLLAKLRGLSREMDQLLVILQRSLIREVKKA